ncbi:MAG TPA: MFS transporter [Polyangia bacterium]|nr:MFS transporter [Polyangia bacterium]
MKTRLHYAFVVAATTFVVLIVAAGVRATPSILIVPLEREFGWNRGVLSSAVSVNLLLYGMVGPFAAAVMGRFGIRRTVTAALALIATGVALTPLMTASWQLVLLWGVLVGVGSGHAAMVLGATVVQRWFVKNRGTVMGVLTASTATGQMIFLPLEAHLAETRGWRSVSLAVTAALLLLIPLALLLMRDRPRDVGLLPYGASPGDAPARESRQNPVANAMRVLRLGFGRPDFWLLAGSFFVCGASTNGLIGTHLVPACMDHGIPEVRAAGLLATMGIFDLVGTTASGWLSDRFDSRRLLFWYYGLRGLALLWLPRAFDGQVLGLPLFAIFYGLDWIATVPPTVKLTSDAFGPDDAPIAFGWIMAAHQIGAATAALAAGVVRTQLSTYTPAWIAAGGICLLAAMLVLRIGRVQSPFSSRTTLKRSPIE